jgi:NitT/TauT family transport system substrate-binding protein
MLGSTRTSFLAGAASALIAAPALAATGDLKTIRVGTLPSSGDANVIYAQDEGFLKDLGLDAKIDYMNNGNSIWDAVLGGSLDVGAGNIGSLAVARARGIPLRVIAPGSAATKDVVSNFVMIAKDSPMRIGADFNNKTIAMTAIKTAGEAVFRLWIDKHGGDSKTIRVIELPYPAMADAVSGHRADAALVVDPYAMIARSTTTLLPVNYFSVLPLPVIITCFVAAEKWLEYNADTARKFAAGMHRAALWANGHQADTHPLLAKITKMDPALVSAMAPTIFATSLDAARIQPVIDAMLAAGFLDKHVDPKDMIWT